MRPAAVAAASDPFGDGSVNGSIRFHGLSPTNMQLEGLEKHQRLIESYRKLHAARAARATTST